MTQETQPAFGLLAQVCKAHMIGRTVAWELANKGLLDTFKIGTRRYVYIDSVRTLPERLDQSIHRTAAASGHA